MATQAGQNLPEDIPADDNFTDGFDNIQERDNPLDEVEVAEQTHEEEHTPSPPPNFNINPPLEVSNLSDNCQTPVPGSLRAAMILANQQPGQDEIVFAAGTQGSITLDCCLPPVLESLGMHGPGAGNLRLDASNTHLCNVIEYHNATPGQQQANK